VTNLRHQLARRGRQVCERSFLQVARALAVAGHALRIAAAVFLFVQTRGLKAETVAPRVSPVATPSAPAGNTAAMPTAGCARAAARCAFRWPATRLLLGSARATATASSSPTTAMAATAASSAWVARSRPVRAPPRSVWSIPVRTSSPCAGLGNAHKSRPPDSPGKRLARRIHQAA
jgi:hypothetical protein